MPKTKKLSQQEALKQLLENNVTLQDKTTDILTEVKHLVKRIDKLLDLFEGAADFLKLEKPEKLASHKSPENDDALTKKLDAIIDSNRQLARSLAVLGRQVPPAGAPAPRR